MALLEISSLSKSFGGLQVIDDVNFSVDRGEIVSLIGPNGAGKTTLLNLITGIYTPSGGDIRLDDESLLGLSPHDITQRGIARTFQNLRLYLNMTVIENVTSAAYARMNTSLVDIIFRTPNFRREEQRIRQLAEEKLAFFGTRLQGYRFEQPAYSLSYANRRRLEIARAMATNPKLLLLDEPAAGMNPNETGEITEIIAQLRDEIGFAILLIEHDMSVVAGCSDRVIALDHGQQIAQGSYDEVASDPRVIEAYLGHANQIK